MRHNGDALKEEMQTQATKAVMMSNYLCDIIWRNKYMSLKSKIRIYKTCVRSVMIYAIETRGNNHHQMPIKIDGNEDLKVHHSGNILRDGIRNEDIRNIREIQNVIR